MHRTLSGCHPSMNLTFQRVFRRRVFPPLVPHPSSVLCPQWREKCTTREDSHPGIQSRFDAQCFSSPASASWKQPPLVSSHTGVRPHAASVVASVEFVDGGSGDASPPLPSFSRFPTSFGKQDGEQEEEVMSIPRDSALYSAYSARHQLDSRSRVNTWELARHKNYHHADWWDENDRKAPSPPPLSSSSSTPREEKSSTSTAEGEAHMYPKEHAMGSREALANEGGVERAGVMALTDARRKHRTHEACYSDELRNEMLADHPASKGESRSTYGLRKIPMPGVCMYQEIVSEAEEVKINDELLKVLQDPGAAYITTETRYCVHLYERELGIPGYDTLAFDMRTASPTLQQVLHRFFYLGLIPSLPNICQVSEMIGNFAGYPVHEKPEAIGSYYGILNFISPTILHFQHKSCPWFPRLYLSPRSVTVVTDPCLSDFKMGYKQTHQPFHEFEYHTRVSKDYRIEVLFATVEVEHLKNLNDSIQLTDYAAKHLAHHTVATLPSSAVLTPSQRGFQAASSVASPRRTSSPSESDPFLASTDSWIKKLRQDLQLDHRSGSGGGISSAQYPSDRSFAVPLDGNLLREEVRKRGLVGAARPSLEAELRGNHTTRGTIEGSCASTSSSAKQHDSLPLSLARQRIDTLIARHHMTSWRIPGKGRTKHRENGESRTRVRREKRDSVSPRVIPHAPSLA